MGFALLLSMVTAICFGVIPAARASRETNAGALRASHQRGGNSAANGPVLLVLTEVTACVVLLAVSGLLIRALSRIQSVDPGFRSENVLSLRTSLPLPKYAATAQRSGFYSQVLSEVKALPGVKNAAYISFLPMVMRGGIWPVKVPVWRRARWIT